MGGEGGRTRTGKLRDPRLGLLAYLVDAVHDEADRLEHVLSEELEARIDSALGYPTHDPHGDPIPTRDLVMPETASSMAVFKDVAG